MFILFIICIWINIKASLRLLPLSLLVYGHHFSITGYILAQSFAILIFTTFVLTSDFWSEVQVIVNSRFLQHQHKQSRWNLLIHRRLTKTKSIGRRLRCIESGSQSDGYGLWSSDSKGVGRRVWIRIGFLRSSFTSF